MRLYDCIWRLLFVVTICGAGIPSQSWGHDVGEPALQKSPVWNQCCGDGNCVPQRVHIVDRELGKKIGVEIEGVTTSVDKEKFSPVPSYRTWVCYFSLGGAIRNENIRCILHPQSSGTN